MTERWITLKQASERLKISYRTALRRWPEWEKHGVKAHKPEGCRKMLFDLNQIDRMVQSSAIN